LSGERSERHGASAPLVEWHVADEVQGLSLLVGAVLASSVDASDKAAVRALGPEGSAARVLSPPKGFGHDARWWQVLAFDSVPAGFVLPVIFDGCARDGLDEATIYHMGVAPAYRGRRLARLLLRQATNTMLDHGVWRIYCDTAAANAPMIHLFESEGWTRHAARECAVRVPRAEPDPV
jgi:ribosomal protein S18 acetylase RimI-like enzyme